MHPARAVRLTSHPAYASTPARPAFQLTKSFASEIPPTMRNFLINSERAGGEGGGARAGVGARGGWGEGGVGWVRVVAGRWGVVGVCEHGVVPAGAGADFATAVEIARSV